MQQSPIPMWNLLTHVPPVLPTPPCAKETDLIIIMARLPEHGGCRYFTSFEISLGRWSLTPAVIPQNHILPGIPLGYLPPTTRPECRHRNCIAHWIDTGQGECLRQEKQ